MRRTAPARVSLAWSVPTVQSLSGAAFAATGGSPSPAGSASAPARVTLLLRAEDDGSTPTYFQITVEAGRAGARSGPKAGPPRGVARDTWQVLTGPHRIEPGTPAGVSADGGGRGCPAVIDVGSHQVVEWGVDDGARGERVFFTRSIGRVPPGFEVRRDGSVLQFSKNF